MLSVKEVKDDGRVKTAARWREEGWVGAKLEGIMVLWALELGKWMRGPDRGRHFTPASFAKREEKTLWEQ